MTTRFGIRRLALATGFSALMASAAGAVEVNFVTGATGNAIEIFRQLFEIWEEETGNTVNIVPMPSSTTTSSPSTGCGWPRRTRTSPSTWWT